MKSVVRSKITLVVAGLALGWALACGLGVAVSEEASAVVEQGTTLDAQLEEARSALEARLAASAIPGAAELAATHELAAGFDGLEEDFSKARACVDALQAMLDRNKTSEDDKVQGLSNRCALVIDEARWKMGAPGRILDQWEALHADDALAVEARERAVSAGEAAQATLARGAELEKAAKSWPYKAKDLEDRRSELTEISAELATHHAALDDAKDIAAVAREVAGIDELAPMVAAAAEDLALRLNSIGQTQVLVLTRLEREAVPMVRVQSWVWSSTTEGDGTMTDLGWQQVDVEIYEQVVANQGMVLESTGSESSAGSTTEVTDWDIAYNAYATTVERVGTEQALPVRAPIDDGTLWELYTAVTGLDAALPGSGVLGEQITEGADEDGIPHQFDLSTRMALEQKYAGQYFDETLHSPTPDGVPLALVGHADFGDWKDEVWVWTPAFLDYWRSGEVVRAEGDERYLSGFTAADYAPYRDWRQEAGWAEQYDEQGHYRMRVFYVGGYRSLARYGASSVRGAGPSARSRGLGEGK